MAQENRQTRQERTWITLAAAVVCLLGGGVLLWLSRRYLLGAALPFLLAYLLSRPLRPLVDRLCAGGHIPRPLAAGGLVTLAVGGTVLLCVQGVRRGIDELGRLVGELTADKDGVVAALGTLLERAGSLSEHIPFLRRFEDTPGYAAFCERLDSLVSAGIDRLAESVAARLPDAAMTVAGWLPGAFVFVTVMLLACYYLAADDGSMARALGGVWVARAPAALRDAIPPLVRRFRRLGRQYVRAYLLLGLLTFLEVFVGLSFLRIRYAFLLAWLIALVDFLPMLGTGVVLVPWGILSLLLGEVRVGIGLLILFGICTLLRQITEPHLFGRGLGLHPLVSLAAVYVGLKLGGVVGMLLAPLAAAVLKSLFFGEESPAQKNNALGRE